jgi:hypothetical protein
MEDELLLSIYHRLFPSASAKPRGHFQHSDAMVALVHLYAVLRGRSDLWASDKKNWPLWARRLKFPSYSQLMRRIPTPQVTQLIEQLNRELRGNLPDSRGKLCDGKPLVVGGFSKDPDARRGKVPAGFAKGYKLHVIFDEQSAAIDAFEVTALDGGEPTAACRLVATLDLRGAVVRGDSNYDSNLLFAAVANAGGRLIAPRKKPHTSLGHHPQHPDRVRSIRHLELGDLVLEDHERHRIRIEQGLAHLTNLPFALAPLPNFVRRLHRVRRWIAAKVLLYHAYLNLRREKAAAA